MAKIRICSDLHSEIWSANNNHKKILAILKRFVIPELEDDKETILVIAGDLGTAKTIEQQRTILKYLSERFEAIVITTGNHEWWDGDWFEHQKVYEELYSSFPNVYFNYENTIKDITFIATTLWTDFNKENPLSMEIARSGMRDYSKVTAKEGMLTPSLVLLEHKASKQTLTTLLEKHTKNKTVVVTHHAPSSLSIDDKYKESNLNPCYYSDLSNLIEEFEPNIWVHGHIHQAKDYKLFKTRVICNPFGYRLWETKTGFDPCKIIEL